MEEISQENDKLDQQIAMQRNSLTTDRLDMSYGELISMYENEENYLSRISTLI